MRIVLVSRASPAVAVQHSKVVSSSGCGHGVEVVVEPDRVVAQPLGLLGHAGHRLVLLDRVGDVDQVLSPALRHEHADFRHSRHTGIAPLRIWSGLGPGWARGLEEQEPLALFRRVGTQLGQQRIVDGRPIRFLLRGLPAAALAAVGQEGDQRHQRIGHALQPAHIFDVFWPYCKVCIGPR